MQEKELRVRELFKKMLEDAAEYARREEYYAEDMKHFRETVQWEFGPIRGYQVFNETEYSFKMDAEIEDPTLVLGCTDLDLARQFLNNEIEHWPAFGATDFQITTKGTDGSPVQMPVRKVAGFAPGNAPTAGSAAENAPTKRRSLTMRLLRIPAFRPLMERTAGPENSNDVRIPINESLGTFKNQSIPLAVLEYFINRASDVYLFPVCPCRALAGCQDFDTKQFGCMALGKGVLRLKTFGSIATKEEAIERSRGAVAAGLLPSLGRVKSDTIIYNALPEQGDQGVSVTADPDLCNGCGDCLEVCIFGGMEIVDGIAVIDREEEGRCRGCGRCERVCAPGAITITIEEGGVERMIARIESHVDVT
jgi:UDP-glucose 4-epimerase